MIRSLWTRLKPSLRAIEMRREDQVTVALLGMLAVGGLGFLAQGGSYLRESPTAAPSFVIDPNGATEAELLLLPRVGPSLAKAILAERKKRPFESPAEVGRTPGIGEKTLVKLLPHLKVERGGAP